MTGKDTSSPDIILIGERAQQLDMLLHIQEFSAMSVLITGPAEIGKTALLQAAHSQLSVHHQVIFIDSFATQSITDIVEQIALSLGCAANLIDLDSHLIQMSAQQETLHLLIDDAHLLDDDTLQLLLEKSTLEHGWHLILSGEDTLKSRLDEMQSLFDNKLYHLIELTPFSEIESEEFITQFYKSTGIDVIPLSAKQIHQMWLLSKGVPGKLLDLIGLEQDHETQRSAGFPMGHVAAVLLIVSALIVSLFYKDENKPAVEEVDLIAALVEQQKQNIKKTEKEEKPEAISDTHAKTMKADELISNQVIKPSPDTPPSVEPKQLVTKQIVSKAETSSVLAKATIKEKSVSTDADLKQRPSHPLLNMPSQSFALQLLGVRSEASAKSFVQRFSREMGSEKLNIYETRYRGEPWFVVVYGPIENKQLANEQAFKLSKTIKSQPWVRPISKIQDDIRQIAE